MRFIKDHLLEVIIIAAIVIIFGIVGYVVWFHATHTCIEWEEGAPTGRYCTNYTYVSTGKNSGYSQCINWKVCRSCTRWVDDDSPEIPAELKIPADRCP